MGNNAMTANRTSRRIFLGAVVFLSAAAAMAAEAAKTAATAPVLASWTLATDDTRLTVGVGKDQPLYLLELSSPAAGWNWTAMPSPFPLMSRAEAGGVQHAVKWVFQEGTVDSGDGRKVTLRFASNQPALELKSVWHARPGRGPVRHTMFLKNNTAGPVWSAQHKALIQRAVATYKTRLRPLIRSADLYHIFPRPDGLHWDGIEYFDPAARRGVAYLFKPAEGNGNDVTKVKLRGLLPGARYRVTFEDGTNRAVEKRGADLAAGIDVRLCGGLVSELMFFEEIAPPTASKE